MLFDAHNHAFRVLAGVPRRGIYDNMRTAVDKVGRGRERQVNARFSAMVSHFLLGELRAIGLTGVELVKNHADYVCKYSLSVSYEYDTDDPYTLEHFLLSGHEIAKRRLLDNCIMPDLESVDFPSPNPEPET